MKEVIYTYLRELRITDNSQDTIKVIRKIKFHLGANFIVDTSESKKHNKVGKTTLLKLIDIIFGATGTKYIYTDSETNSTNRDLYMFIKEKKVAVEAFFVSSLATPNKGESYHLKVDLFRRGSHYINGKKTNYDNYKYALNEIFFKNNSDIPTFRQLINSFIRVSLKKDYSEFLKNLSHASTQAYRETYNYLFEISDPQKNRDLDSLNKRLKELTISLNRFEDINNFHGIEATNQIINQLKNDKTDINQKLTDIVNKTEFEANRDKFNKVRNEYTKLLTKIENINYNIRKNEELIAEESKSSASQIDDSLSKKFFKEVNSIIPELNKTFNQMIAFNNKLRENKISYYTEVNNSLKKKLNDLSNQKEQLLRTNHQFLSLVQDDKIGDYENLINNLNRINTLITEHTTKITSVKKFQKDINSTQEKIDSLKEEIEKDANQYESKMNIFNRFFKDFSSKITGEQAILTYNTNPDKFPLSLQNIDGTSTGTRKSLIAAYDLAYQHFAKEIKKPIPNIIAHDVLENIEGKSLRSIIEIANNTDAQYIVAILKEKLDSSNIPESKQKELAVIQLSDKKKLFKI